MIKIFHSKYEAVFFVKMLKYVREHMTLDEIMVYLNQIEKERKEQGLW